MGDNWAARFSEASGDDAGNRMLRESGEGRWGCTGGTQTFTVRRHVGFRAVKRTSTVRAPRPWPSLIISVT